MELPRSTLSYKLTKFVFNKFSNHSQVDEIYLDISKAINRVNHKVSNTCLRHFFIRRLSYLTMALWNLYKHGSAFTYLIGSNSNKNQ